MIDKHNYMLLTTMTKQAAASGKKLLENIHKIDTQAKPLWFDASHVGIVLTTHHPAVDIWKLALDGIPDLNDILIVEIGNDWTARIESKYDHWFTRHVGTPRYTLTQR